MRPFSTSLIIFAAVLPAAMTTYAEDDYYKIFSASILTKT
jgi:hypothetical protein